MKSAPTLCLIVVPVLLACGCAQREEPTRTVATTEQLMYGMIEPLSNVVFNSVQTIVDTDGVHEILPQTEDEWEFIRNSALSLADAGNLVMVDRELSEGTPERGDDWAGYVNGMMDTAQEAAEAARQRDAEALFTAGSNLYENGCLACHQAYLPENAESAF